MKNKKTTNLCRIIVLAVIIECVMAGCASSGTVSSNAHEANVVNDSSPVVVKTEPNPTGITEDGLKYEIINNSRITITGNSLNSYHIVVIPDSIQGLPVTEIGDSAFQLSGWITGVVIPSSVTRIGDSAFHGNGPNFKSAIISSSVISIGKSAFAGNGLTNVVIPSSVTYIGFQAFNGESLININVDSNNAVYASIDGVLFDKNIQTLIKYPGGKQVRTYVIPLSVTSIGDAAFDGKNLRNVTIPSSVTSIGKYAFSGNINLSNVTILSSSVTYIGERAFSECESLTSITIPSSVISIGDMAFYECESLTSITIPSSVISIGERAFGETRLLKNIIVDNNNPAFASIDGVLFDKSIKTLIKYPEGKQVNTYVIPNSVTSIREATFQSCTSLTSITIPNSVTSIGYNAFYNCSSLASVTFQGVITSNNFSSSNSFPGDLRDKYLAGGIGTYTRASGSETWTKK